MESQKGNVDFRDLLRRFAEENVRYLVIGGVALAYYGRPRYTKDLDIWIDPAGDNAARVFRVLASFGAPLSGLTEDDFRDPNSIYMFGREPGRIDILNDVDGVLFDEAWNRRKVDRYMDATVNIIARDDLIASKRATGRAGDLRDIEALLEDEQS
jgi:hypothetical protein